jgi:hypothetical protein
MMDGDGSGFSQGLDDDPFEGSEFDDELMGGGESEGATTISQAAQAAVTHPAPAEAAQPIAQAGVAQEPELPVVNREGEPVDPPIAPTTGASTVQPVATSPAATPEPASAPADQTAPSSSESPVLSGPGEPGELRREPEEVTPERAAEELSVNAAVAEALVADPSEPQETEKAARGGAMLGSPGEPEPDPTQPFEPPSASEPTQDVLEPLEPEDAAPPEQVATKDGRVTHRRYVVLTPDRGGVFRRVYWYEKNGELCTRGTPGAKRQSLALARDADGARAIAYRALGNEGPVDLVAVSESNFQVVTVEPDEPKPAKRKLKMTRR